MHARFIGLDSWSPPLHTIELQAGSRYLDLHNDTALLGFRLGGHPKLTLTVDFRHDRHGPFALEFRDVGELRMEQDSVSSDGWVGIPDVEPEGIDMIEYYEYGRELPPVFEILSLNFRLRFRAWEVAYITESGDGAGTAGPQQQHHS
ncbi:hypothetical protein ACFXPX_20675 [Kitasatospora sp. NPDC059146]|uniref:hypothetical protein n=1 Tax=Kitasatospora sp. NPDC059146 TaxID=3346741 RepID=UPI0036B3D111